MLLSNLHETASYNNHSLCYGPIINNFSKYLSETWSQRSVVTFKFSIVTFLRSMTCLISIKGKLCEEKIFQLQSMSNSFWGWGLVTTHLGVHFFSVLENWEGNRRFWRWTDLRLYYSCNHCPHVGPAHTTSASLGPWLDSKCSKTVSRMFL